MKTTSSNSGQSGPKFHDVCLDGQSLGPDALSNWADTANDPSSRLRIRMGPDSHERIDRANRFVETLLARGGLIYGINTGLGDLAEVEIPREKLAMMQLNLIRSHCCAVGEELPRDVVMAMWLIRLNTICRGHSGTHPQTVEMIVRLLEAGILPCVPSRGSVGASGDLAPAAHAALCLFGEGECTFTAGAGVSRISGKKALELVGLKARALGPKEALSLINGTSLSTALAVKALSRARNLLAHANLAVALTSLALEARSCNVPLKALEQHRHPGTMVCGREISQWLNDPKSSPSDGNGSRIQDAYSIRCAPQVHGMVWDETQHAQGVLQNEINASDDNPLLFPDSQEVLSCGNFHAIQPARVSDKLATAMTTLGTISERRIFLAMKNRVTGLADFLVRDGGWNSGFMMVQVTAAALASECKSLSFPASVDTIPTNSDREDHVSMGPLAGFKAIQIAQCLRTIVAIELLVAAQAVDLQKLSSLPARLRTVHESIRRIVPFLERDRVLSHDIEALSSMIETRDLLAGFSER